MIFSEVVDGQELKHMESGTIIRKGKAARGIRGQNNTGIIK